MKLTKEAVEKAFPEMAKFSPNGKNDFDYVALVLDSRNPKQVWAVINLYQKSAKVSRHASKLQKLFG